MKYIFYSSIEHELFRMLLNTPDSNCASLSIFAYGLSSNTKFGAIVKAFYSIGLNSTLNAPKESISDD
jgi:hypothetical protein